MTELTPNLLAYLEKPNIAIFTTLRKDGTPHQTAVWYEFVDGEVRVSVTNGRIKYKQVQRDPRVSVAVASQTLPYVQVIFEGVAQLEEEGGPELFRRLAIKYYGEEGGNAYADYDRDVSGEPRMVLRFTPAKIRAWDFAEVDDYHRPWGEGYPTAESLTVASESVAK